MFSGKKITDSEDHVRKRALMIEQVPIRDLAFEKPLDQDLVADLIVTVDIPVIR